MYQLPVTRTADVHACFRRVCVSDRLMVDARHGLHSKLTGAGGGGCGFTLLPPSASSEAVTGLTVDMQALGYELFETSAGGPGVLLHGRSRSAGK